MSPVNEKPAEVVKLLSQRAPFCGPSEPRGSARATLDGRLPSWLRGTVLRSAPMLDARSKWAPTHLFDGLALLFGLQVGGADVALTWSLLDSEVARAGRSG